MNRFQLTEQQWNALLERDDCPEEIGTPERLVDALSYARETLDSINMSHAGLWSLDIHDSSDTVSETLLVMLDVEKDEFYLTSPHIDMRALRYNNEQPPFRHALGEVLAIAESMHNAWKDATL